jgi:hypothetical protein
MGTWCGKINFDPAPFFIWKHSGPASRPAREVTLLCHTLPTMMFCLTRSPETMEPIDHDLKPLKPWAKNLSFLL